MAIWTERVVPHLTDAALSTPEVMELRRRVCPGLYGKVIEIGFGRSGPDGRHLTEPEARTTRR